MEEITLSRCGQETARLLYLHNTPPTHTHTPSSSLNTPNLLLLLKTTMYIFHILIQNIFQESVRSWEKWLNRKFYSFFCAIYQGLLFFFCSPYSTDCSLLLRLCSVLIYFTPFTVHLADRRKETDDWFLIGPCCTAV